MGRWGAPLGHVWREGRAGLREQSLFGETTDVCTVCHSHALRGAAVEREPGGLALAWDPKPAVGGSGTWPLMSEVPGAAGGLAGRVGEAGCAPHLLGAAQSPARPPGELACRAHGWPTMQCAQALQSCPVSWPVRSRWAWLWPPCGRRLVVAGPLGRRGQFCSDCCLLAVSSQAPLQTGALARGLAVPQDAANLNVCSATEQGPRWRALGPSWGGPSAW